MNKPRSKKDQNRKNAAKIERYLDGIEKKYGFEEAWSLRCGFERGEYTLRELRLERGEKVHAHE